MHRALELAGGARGVEPEREVVGQRRRRRELRARAAEERVEGERFARGGPVDDHPLEEGLAREDRRDLVEDRRRDHEDARAGVAEEIVVVGGGEQRVHRHRDRADLDRPEEDRREAHRVVEHEEHALFHAHAEAAKRIAGAVHLLGEAGIGELGGVVDEGDLGPAPLGEVAIDEVDGGVVDAGMSSEGGEVERSAIA